MEEENIVPAIAAVMVVVFVVALLVGAGYVTGREDSRDSFMQEGAMEVYKGNTILKYEVVDSVKVDSCVIFIDR